MHVSCSFRGCQNEGRPLINDHLEGPYDGFGDSSSWMKIAAGLKHTTKKSRKADLKVVEGVNAYGQPDRKISVF